eukprot:CAMPEP_0114499800 /NCGR_PEP_ID=MMETSP0109-20121206/7616_1 /TAXON_ID=29199 /ORGANISM="Chlorarachnion reptans, Strain CCCM449" /LENGTH=125 /DNA_ID=CAMNT_0001677403 /DNA_START=238 /DNA_END=615 /DNA_ORIENTATION=+
MEDLIREVENSGGSSKRAKPKTPSWLVEWNPDNDPQTMSCTKAFDAVVYCHRPPQLLSAYYRKGLPMDCAKQLQDFNFCMKVRMKAIKDYEGAKQMISKYDVKVEKAHPIFKPRTRPPGPWGCLD